MSYTSQSAIETFIPGPHLLNALDDDGDGQADDGKLDAIIAVASNGVDAYLAGRFAVPFADPPAPVKEAALIFSCELIHDRRLKTGEANPFTARADMWRTTLEKIGKGEIQLSTDTAQARDPGAIIGECAAVNDTLR